MIRSVQTSACKVPVILVRFYSNSNFRKKTCEKYSKIKFHENPPCGIGVVPREQTDGHDDNSRFSEHCERAWNKWHCLPLWMSINTRTAWPTVCEDSHESQRKYRWLIRPSSARRTEHGGSNSNASDIIGRWPPRFSSAATTILKFNAVLCTPSSQILIQHVESGRDCSLLHPFQCAVCHHPNHAASCDMHEVNRSRGTQETP